MPARGLPWVQPSPGELPKSRESRDSPIVWCGQSAVCSEFHGAGWSAHGCARPVVLPRHWARGAELGVGPPAGHIQYIHVHMLLSRSMRCIDSTEWGVASPASPQDHASMRV